jgi:hypothetical protein
MNTNECFESCTKYGKDNKNDIDKNGRYNKKDMVVQVEESFKLCFQSPIVTISLQVFL